MKNKFKYVIISVILLIPFIYSFFYLKAYWDPYGKGNIDNIPVAIVNEDKGQNGEKLIKSIKESEKLKPYTPTKEEAKEGLNNGKYYAIIKIPESFTNDLESASKENKKHAQIEYLPNQKSNFLASQIINSVVNAVEKNLDNEVNSKIVGTLSNNIKNLPNSLSLISEGFSKLKDGTSKLYNGSNTLSNGSSTLNQKYSEFNSGVSTLNKGAEKIKDGSDKLTSGLKLAKDGSEQIKNAVDSKIEEVKNDTSSALSDDEINQIGLLAQNTISQNENVIKASALEKLSQNPIYNSILSGITNIENYYINNGITTKELCVSLQDETQIKTCEENLIRYQFLKEEKILMEETTKTAAYNASLEVAKTSAQNAAAQVAQAAKEKAKQTSVASLSELSSGLNSLNKGLVDLYNGSKELALGTHSLFNGTESLNNGSNQFMSGINTLNAGANTLNDGIKTLDNSILEAKSKIDTNVDETKEKVKSVESLENYSKAPIKIKTKEVNKVKSYGTSFSPLFISIGLWIGCLMMFIVLYYDKEERFGIFTNTANNKVKQILSYHGLITASSLVLGMLLNLLLDFDVSNIPLYYISLVLIGNAFMGIIEFLIITFNDIGKFIALVLLVLQLAASGGTFPIETVTKGFRWLNPYLPMTYTINLLKESLVKVDNNLLTNNLIIILAIAIFFISLNILLAKLKENKVEE